MPNFHGETSRDYRDTRETDAAPSQGSAAPQERDHSMQLASNTVLITGGASGIGLELAKRFLQEGSTVLACGRREEKLAEARKIYPELKTLACDLAKEKDRKRIHEWASGEFPRLNVLVNNAGIQRRVRIADQKRWMPTHDEIAINFEAPVHLCSLFVPPLLKQ